MRTFRDLIYLPEQATPCNIMLANITLPRGVLPGQVSKIALQGQSCVRPWYAKDQRGLSDFPDYSNPVCLGKGILGAVTSAG